VGATGIDGWMDGRTDGWMDGRMDGRLDGRMDGWMDRQAGRIAPQELRSIELVSWLVSQLVS
jgi:hypothetical protein